mgnify:FL=1
MCNRVNDIIHFTECQIKIQKKKHISKFYERPCPIIKILCGESERLEMQKKPPEQEGGFLP